MVEKVSIGTESFPTVISAVRFLTCEMPDVGRDFILSEVLPHSCHSEGFPPRWARWAM